MKFRKHLKTKNKHRYSMGNIPTRSYTVSINKDFCCITSVTCIPRNGAFAGSLSLDVLIQRPQGIIDIGAMP